MACPLPDLRSNRCGRISVHPRRWPETKGKTLADIKPRRDGQIRSGPLSRGGRQRTFIVLDKFPDPLIGELVLQVKTVPGSIQIQVLVWNLPKRLAAFIDAGIHKILSRKRLFLACPLFQE